jgi:AAA-like domain
LFALWITPPTRRIGQRDSILLLKGARQMGKTSLLSRALEQARGSGFRVAVTDFQKLNSAHLSSPRELFTALGSMIALQLDLDVFPPDVWREHLGPNDNFERYLRREVLAKSPAPLVWAMDEVDRLFSVRLPAKCLASSARGTTPARSNPPGRGAI